jgi:hypothetical protein
MNILKYPEEFQTSVEISRESFSGVWQCWYNRLALPSASLFIGRGSSGYDKLFYEFLNGRRVGITAMDTRMVSHSNWAKQPNKLRENCHRFAEADQ